MAQLALPFLFTTSTAAFNSHYFVDSTREGTRRRPLERFKSDGSRAVVTLTLYVFQHTVEAKFPGNVHGGILGEKTPTMIPYFKFCVAFVDSLNRGGGKTRPSPFGWESVLPRATHGRDVRRRVHPDTQFQIAPPVSIVSQTICAHGIYCC